MRDPKTSIEHSATAPAYALVVADADHIQAYVFESAKIAEVRGASALVERLNFKGLEQIIIEDHGLSYDAIVYRGGGGAMLKVPIDLAEGIRQAIEAHFLQETQVATITTVSLPVTEAQLNDRDEFQKLRVELTHSLQIKKLKKATAPHFEWLSFAQRCPAC